MSAHPVGTRVTFRWRGQWLTGEVVDSITFNDQTHHGVRVDGPTAIDPTPPPGGRVYDVWQEITPVQAQKGA
jgi:hypothetical protein